MLSLHSSLDLFSWVGPGWIEGEDHPLPMPQQLPSPSMMITIEQTYWNNSINNATFCLVHHLADKDHVWDDKYGQQDQNYAIFIC